MRARFFDFDGRCIEDLEIDRVRATVVVYEPVDMQTGMSLDCQRVNNSAERLRVLMTFRLEGIGSDGIAAYQRQPRARAPAPLDQDTSASCTGSDVEGYPRR